MAAKYAVQAIPVVEYKGNNAQELCDLATERLGDGWSVASQTSGQAVIHFLEPGTTSPRVFTVKAGEHFTPHNGGTVIDAAEWAARWVKV